MMPCRHARRRIRRADTNGKMQVLLQEQFCFVGLLRGGPDGTNRPDLASLFALDMAQHEL
jgi:hypothetical protein